MDYPHGKYPFSREKRIASPIIPKVKTVTRNKRVTVFTYMRNYQLRNFAGGL